jgi:hypothetical protein
MYLSCFRASENADWLFSFVSSVSSVSSKMLDSIWLSGTVLLDGVALLGLSTGEFSVGEATGAIFETFLQSTCFKFS